MPLLRSLPFLLWVALAAQAAHAQYVSVSAAAAEQQAGETTQREAAQRAFIGRRYWIVPDANATTRAQFYEPTSGGLRSFHAFVVTESTNFTVTSFAPGDFTDFVKVTFADGKVAFLAQARWYTKDDYATLFDHEYGGYGDKTEGVEYVLIAPPEDIAAVEKKEKARRVAAATAWKARGGVQVGMSKKQVLASNWGRPERVNSTTGSYGTHEQWVYSGGNYLYFENGMLTSIQN